MTECARPMPGSDPGPPDRPYGCYLSGCRPRRLLPVSSNRLLVLQLIARYEAGWPSPVKPPISGCYPRLDPALRSCCLASAVGAQGRCEHARTDRVEVVEVVAHRPEPVSY